MKAVSELVLGQLMGVVGSLAGFMGVAPWGLHHIETRHETTLGCEDMCRSFATGRVPVGGADAPGAMQHYAVESSAAAPSPATKSAATAARAASGNCAATGTEQQPGSGSAKPHDSDPVADITFTATRSASGALLLGSSREEAGFDAAPSDAVAEAILARCAAFLPQARLHWHTFAS